MHLRLEIKEKLVTLKDNYMGELTREGQRMFDNLMKYQELNAPVLVDNVSPPPPPEVKTIIELENEHLKTEIARMIKNSEMVVEDCNKILAKITSQAEYMTSDAKVAKTLHERNIERLTRILDGKPAFDIKVKLDDED